MQTVADKIDYDKCCAIAVRIGCPFFSVHHGPGDRHTVAYHRNPYSRRVRGIVYRVVRGATGVLDYFVNS